MPRKLLVLSIEFLGPVFSGNGQYSRCLVRGLKAAGAQVLVISGRKCDVPLEQQDAEGQQHMLAPHGVVDIPLDRWGTLDASSDWAGFADGAGDRAVAKRVIDFCPDAVLCVDWHGFLGWQALLGQLEAQGSPLSSSLPTVYLNFRVYSLSIGLSTFTDDAPFYRRVEAAAVRQCTVSVALCRSDAVALSSLALGRDPVTRELVDGEGFRSAERGQQQHWAPQRGGARLPAVKILLPPLRSDILKLAAAEEEGSASASSSAPEQQRRRRRYLTCVVRLSPEKGPHRFVELVRALAPTLQRLGVVPFMAGAAGDKAYAESVVSGLKAAMPEAEVVTSFMGPPDLHKLFSSTVLNVHPALMDAYGMTVIEAAAFGAPSLVHVPKELQRSGTDDATSAADGDASESSAGDLISFSAGCAGVAISTAGYLQMNWGTSVIDSEGTKLTEQLCVLSFPPVGACALLLPAPRNDNIGATTVPPVIAVDLSSTIEDVASRVGTMLEEAVAAEEAAAAASSSSASLSHLSSVGHRARCIALSWAENDTAAALLDIIQGAVEAHSGKA